MQPIRLVATRLVAMTKVHPEQATMDCAVCGEKVGVYPSGQKAIRLTPGPVEVVCQACAAKEHDPERDTAQPVDEIMQEALDSRDVGKA